MDRHAFVEEMERRYGSDEAIGVRLRLDDSAEVITPAEYDRRYAALPRGARPGSESLLPTGGSAVCCTEYACLIFKQLPGRVQIFGFANENNPTSRVAREEIHPGGHDFAVVDDRFIVDPWLRLVAGVSEQIVFDLADPGDASLAADVYGPRQCWERLTGAEAYAQKLRAA